MIDSGLQPWLDPVLKWTAALLLRITHGKIRANHLTFAGFAVGVLCLPLLALGHYDYGLLALLINRLLDGLDGAVARLTGVTDQGGFLDITLDFIFYSLFVLGATIADPAHAVYGAFLIFSFVANGSAFLAFSIFEARHPVAKPSPPGKSFHYLGGLAEGFETFVALALMCLIPDGFWLIALVFGTLCCLSAAYRIWFAYVKLGSS